MDHFIIYTGKGHLSNNAYLVSADLLSGEFIGTSDLSQARMMTMASAERMARTLAANTEPGLVSWEPMGIGEAKAMQRAEARAVIHTEHTLGGCNPLTLARALALANA